MFDYRLARPNETKLLDYLEECGANWEEIAKSLIGYLSDDDVKDWAESNEYDIFDEEDE